MVKKGSLILSLLLFIVLQVPGDLVGTLTIASAQSVNKTIQILSSDANGVVVELNLPQFSLEIDQSDEGFCQRIQVDDWGILGDTGQPALPFKGDLIGLPLYGEARLSVLEIGPEIVIENFNLCPVAGLVSIDDPITFLPQVEEQIRPDPAAYSSLNTWPGEWSVLGSSTFLRSQRVVQLRLQPFQYQPATHRLHYTTHMLVRVSFSTPLTTAVSFVDEGSFESILKNTLLNYSSARFWREDQIIPAADTSITNPDQSVQLAVSNDGIYRITYSDLLAEGVSVDGPDFDPHSFRLLKEGTEVAISVSGESDGKFDPGDDLLFFGQKNTGRYTDTNIYWLTWGGVNGQRIVELDGTPVAGETETSFISTIRAEQNLAYRSNYPSGSSQDRWYWDLILASSVPISKSYIISLSHVSTGTPLGTTAVVRGLLHGYSASPQHHTRIYLNNALIYDNTWPSKDDLPFEVTVPYSLLLEGNNTIKVESPMDSDITLDYTLVNWFEVVYQRDYAADNGVARFNGNQTGEAIFQIPGFTNSPAEIWDITTTLDPQRIMNSTFIGNTLIFQQENSNLHNYIAVDAGNINEPDSITFVQLTGLHSSANGADYILISHPDFLKSIQPLADYRASQGLRVKVVNVQDIYNEFGDGTLDPDAIRDFLAYAYSTWVRPAPSYVVLIGDGNYDFKNYKGFNEKNYIPPYLADVDPWMGEVPADNLYVAFNPTDGLPSMALGRLPVKTPAEAATVVQKILAYSQNLSDTWDKKIQVVADIPDYAGDFNADADVFASQLPSRFVIDKVYLPVGATSSDVIAARQSIFNGINEGRLIVHYTGHSSAYDWSGKVIFSKQNVPTLTNINRLPFILSMTCYVGYYANPSPSGSDYSGFDEVLVRAANGGAIATWSPTGEGTAAGHAVLDAGFTQAAFHSHLLQIGISTTQAKYYLYANSPSYHELINTYLLLGDPALSLPLDINVYLPSIQR